MKIIKTIIVLFSMAFFFVSCSEDENTPIDTNAQESDLIGTWNLITVTQEGKANVTYQNIPASGDISANGKNIDAQLIVSESPKNLSASGGYISETTASVLTESRTFDIPIVLDDVLTQSSWSLNSGVIMLTQGSETVTVDITELNSTSLKIEFDYDGEISVQEFLDGAPVTFDTRVKMTFTKQ